MRRSKKEEPGAFPSPFLCSKYIHVHGGSGTVNGRLLWELGELRADGQYELRDAPSNRERPPSYCGHLTLTFCDGHWRKPNGEEVYFYRQLTTNPPTYEAI